MTDGGNDTTEGNRTSRLVEALAAPAHPKPAWQPGDWTVDRTDPGIVAVVPNPVAAEDRGERVVVDLPPPYRNGTVTIDDGEDRIRLPALDGRRVVVTAEPAAVPTDGDGDRSPVVVGADVALANGGERLTLRVDGRVVDTVSYEDAPAGERLVRTDDGATRWVPVGLDRRRVAHLGTAPVTAFVLPDAPDAPRSFLRSADERLLVAGYTFASRRAARALVAAAARGVEVRVLVDADPVGGVTTRQAATLEYLESRGVDVAALGGPRARFAFHHAKYAVADDRALVLTENWKPAGTGGNDSRGWGVVVDSPALADELAAVFAHDAGWRDTRPWRDVAPSEPERVPAANGTFAGDRPPATVDAHSVRLLTAPGNAEDALVAEIDGATDRIAVLQPTLGGPDQRLVRAVVRAAARGVRVRILLSRAWYVREENRELASALNRRAANEDLPLTVKLARGGNRFGTVHAKGLVVDDTAVVGSLNWNDHSAGENREVAVALDGPPAEYFRRAFAADWERGRVPGRERVPVGLIGTAVVALVGALLAGRRLLAFDGDGSATRFEDWRP